MTFFFWMCLITITVLMALSSVSMSRRNARLKDELKVIKKLMKSTDNYIELVDEEIKKDKSEEKKNGSTSNKDRNDNDEFMNLPQKPASLTVQVHNDKPYKSPLCPDGIDVVWLWVNGSEPAFIKALQENGRKGGLGRYRDYNTLQYSMRSVYEFAPYIKHYHIVTMGQTPSFVNTSSMTYRDYTLRIVDHKEIFPNLSDLPVFNSNALEVSLHNIKNLSKCFLYMNDDMLLGKPLNPEHFINNKEQRFNIYHNSWSAPEVERAKKNVWHNSVSFTNNLINAKFHNGEEVKHSYSSHHCYFFDRNTLQEMERTWPYNYAKTRTHKFRERNDLAVPFFYAAYSVETGRGKYVKERNYYYGTFTDVHKSNQKVFKDINKRRPQCICLNDGISDNVEASVINQEIDYLENFFDRYYSYPSPFEKNVIKT